MATTSPRIDKILVVDDDARIRDLLRRYLTQEGLEVILAEDGKALNRILLRETVDLIVLDLMMPGEDGLSICRRLRSAILEMRPSFSANTGSYWLRIVFSNSSILPAAFNASWCARCRSSSASFALRAASFFSASNAS